MAVKEVVTRLTKSLNNSRTQRDNNALYQTIVGLIQNVGDILSNFVTAVTFNNYINSVRYVNVIEFDTSTVAPTVALSDYVFNNFYIFKDTAGNAATNNITLTGTVDGTVNPVINTNFGLYRVYRSQITGNFYQW